MVVSQVRCVGDRAKSAYMSSRGHRTDVDRVRLNYVGLHGDAANKSESFIQFAMVLQSLMYGIIYTGASLSVNCDSWLSF